MIDASDSGPSCGTTGFHDDEVVAAVKRYMELIDRGDAPDIQEYLRGHAAISEQLRPALEGLALVHGGPPSTGSRPSVSASESELTNKPIGDFQIIREIGRGGMGVVYEAIQMSLGRRVALKVLPFASGLDPVRLQRFRNEAHAAAQLHHTNIVPVYAVGNERGIQYYAMQLISGHTLSELLENMRLAKSASKSTGGKSPTEPTASHNETNKTSNNDFSRTLRSLNSTVIATAAEKQRYFESVVRMIRQAALALEHAHQYGVIHRDIKPGNLMLDGQGTLWITDFGLAHILHTDSSLTRSGDQIGTLRYMSPEQAAGNRDLLDHRTDIYSLGITLYELLTLEHAIRGKDYREMLNQIAEQEPIPPKTIDPTIPVELDTIVRKAISKEPSQRYATAGAFGDDLERWLLHKPIAAKPTTFLERLKKWRKRNSLLVNIGIAAAGLSSIGLLITTMIVLREQSETRRALENEMKQRTAAEQNFQKARLAVDTFSELSESELAHRPEVQGLRRKILETSLEFYRDFVVLRSEVTKDSQELTAATSKVEKLVEELQLLDSFTPLLLLGDPRVVQELRIQEEIADEFREAIGTVQDERAKLGSEGGIPLAGNNSQISELIRDFVAYARPRIDAEQWKRLKQLELQRRMPRALETSEVANALKLTAEQRQMVRRIIQEEFAVEPAFGGPRPPMAPGPNGPDRGPPMPGFLDRGRGSFGTPPPGNPENRGERNAHRGRPDSPPEGPNMRPNDRFNKGGSRNFRGELDIRATRRIVQRLRELLSEDQRRLWEELVGPLVEMETNRPPRP